VDYIHIYVYGKLRVSLFRFQCSQGIHFESRRLKTRSTVLFEKFICIRAGVCVPVERVSKELSLKAALAALQDAVDKNVMNVFIFSWLVDCIFKQC
jgi:hypothetical protein